MAGNVTVWDALPDGRLLTAQTEDRGLMEVRLRGEDSARDLSWLDASQIADLSRDGRIALFTEYGLGGGVEPSAYLRGTDGSAAIRLGKGWAVALSPDARWAICRPGGSPLPYLELLPTGAGSARRVEGHGLSYQGAEWLPDGQRLVVSAFEPGRPSRLYRQEIDGGQPVAITPEGVRAWVVSPDGATVAARGPDSTIRLYGVDQAMTPQEVPGVTGSDVPVGWIPDGLLVMRRGDPASPRGEIHRIDPRTGRQDAWRNIFPRDPAGIMGDFVFRVTPDGQSYAYSWHRALSSLYLADGLA